MSKHRYSNNNQHGGAATAAPLPEVTPEAAEEGVLLDKETAEAESEMLDTEVAETEAIPEAAAEASDSASEKPEKQRVALSLEVEEEKPELVVELSKIYDFDGEEIESVDLSGLENISVKQQIKVDKIYRKITKSVSSTPEFTPDYAVAMTHVLTDIPLEIVRQFSFKDKIRIKNAIMGFLYGDD
ncbi:MAG: hypothetical protein ACI4EA_12375 [Candidatus Ornithomonoglobus sp.]